jgi:hypothetical protein
MSRTNKRVFAEELHDYIWQFAKDKTPSPSEIEKFINDFEQKIGFPIFIKEEQIDKKTAVLLKPSTESKRLRELAGIPHKGNFI